MKKLSVIALIVVVLSLVGYGTLAYTVVEEKATNVITTGGVEIRLVEMMDGEVPFPAGGIDGIIPGAVASKIVTVKNTGAQPAWVRLKVETVITLAPPYQGQTPDPALVRPNFNTQDWEPRGGYYYYKTALAPNAETKPLFTQVEFDAAMDNKYQGNRAQLTVTAYATQVKNNGDTPFKAEGWPA